MPKTCVNHLREMFPTLSFVTFSFKKSDYLQGIKKKDLKQNEMFGWFDPWTNLDDDAATGIDLPGLAFLVQFAETCPLTQLLSIINLRTDCSNK